MAEEIAKRLLGTWRMLSWTRALEDNERSDAFGPAPQGYVTYTADGRVIALVLKRHRPMPSQVPPTPAEKIQLFDSIFAYAGTYTVEADRVVHHIDTSWNEAWTGTHQVRLCEFAANRLTYRSLPTRDPMDGRDCIYTIELEKVPPLTIGET